VAEICRNHVGACRNRTYWYVGTGGGVSYKKAICRNGTYKHKAGWRICGCCFWVIFLICRRVGMEMCGGVVYVFTF
jgi:hypothetical protein